MNKIDWEKDYDKNNNTFWFGGSPYNGGDSDDAFYWKIKQKLRGDKIVWVLRSDDELMLDGDWESEYDNLESAKSYCQIQRDQIIEDFQHEKGSINQMNKEVIREIIKEIKAEITSPTCASYEYDSTPTERERMNNIGVLIRELEEGLFDE